MYLKDFKNILNDETISCEQFLRIHCCVEELFRRLLLIGLRLQGVQYKESELISENYYNRDQNEKLKLALKYCNINYQDLLKYNNFNELQMLYLKFTCRHRNKLMHGVALTYNDNDLLKLLITVDRSFILEIESFFEHIKKPSIFAKPSKWGAKKGIKKDASKIYKELLGKNMPLPHEYTKNKVNLIMKKLKILK